MPNSLVEMQIEIVQQRNACDMMDIYCGALKDNYAFVVKRAKLSTIRKSATFSLSVYNLSYYNHDEL